jgi:methionine synthase / methylenetetrahydrofolate reductase(NADPH)
MRGPEFLARLRDEVLVGDGALGTMISEHGVSRQTHYERLNHLDPGLVRGLHAAYLAAGAQVLETNTFGANRTKLGALHAPDEVTKLNRLGVALAREVAGEQTFVAGAVGPPAGPHGHHTPTDDEIRDAFREQIIALAEAGADLLMLETFTDLHQLLLVLEVAKKHTDLPVVCQMAYHERGHTQSGVHVLTALEALTAAGADVIGANCGRGVRCVVNAVEQLTARGDCLVSAFPNAGLPEYADGRYLFGAPLPYLTESAERMVAAGVNLIGGCCGTTPEYVRRVSERVKGRKPAVRVRVTVTVRSVSEGPAPALTLRADQPFPPLPVPPGSILDDLPDADAPRRPLVVVELDPPRGLNYQPILRRALQLRDMGVDAITMADNPVATLHMGNLGFAQIVQAEAGVPVIVHLTCRDHNLLGLQSILLTAHAMGLHHLLALTGDPARVGDQPGASSVYDLNSIGLVELINKFNHGVQNAGMPLGGRTSFSVAVAFNPGGTDRKLAHEVSRLRKKVAAGAHYALTQPIYEAGRFVQAKAAVRDLNIPLFAGVMPLLSDRNAEFLHNEVPGICLSDEVRHRMKGVSGKEGRRLGVQIAKELLDAMLPAADGIYIVPPQRFTEMAVELVEHIHQRTAVSNAV